MTPIAVARGDGIGPEIMDAVLHILKEAGTKLDIHEVKIGEEVYLQGVQTGIEPGTWDILKNTDAFLKAPITTPQGGGFKSLNVTIRGSFSLYANVRPCVSYSPYVQTKHPDMDVVIIRENEEDLYAGIEYRQSQDVCHALKIISRSGSERIIRYAFEYAVKSGRKKVTCFSKDNILKITDGLFHEVFEEVAKEYPQIENEHWIIDIGAAKLADSPENFDVIVMQNLYGDILSDIAAQIAGSVGLAGSANIGLNMAMFEAIHGSAPRRARQNLANPSGLLLGSLMMLQHIGQGEASSLIHNAWLKTLEEGIHTYDIFKEGVSKEKVGTKEFAKAVAERLGQKPETLTPAKPHDPVIPTAAKPIKPSTRALKGVDLYVQHLGDIDSLAKLGETLNSDIFKMTLITNRGVRVWPTSVSETTCVDQYRLRFRGVGSIAELHKKAEDLGLYVLQTENLYSFDGVNTFSMSDV